MSKKASDLKEEVTTKEQGGDSPISVKLQIVTMIKIQKLDVILMPMTVD